MGENRWVKIRGWKCVGGNSRVKMNGWIRGGELFPKKSLVCPRIIRRSVSILYWFNWIYWTTPRKSLLWWLFYLPVSSSATVYYTFVYVCVCVWERESVCVCNTLWNSAEICVGIRKLAKTGDVGRPACVDFGCYCALDVFCPLMLLATARPFFMLITCVCVCDCQYVSACL